MILSYADIFPAGRCMKMNKEALMRSILENHEGRPSQYLVLNEK